LNADILEYIPMDVAILSDILEYIPMDVVIPFSEGESYQVGLNNNMERVTKYVYTSISKYI
jgi:hypothetical protein